jgi:hypothetical protein
MISDSWASLAEKNSKFTNAPKRPRPNELVEIYGKENFSNEYKAIRLFGPIKADANHLIRGKIKKKDGVIKEVFFAVPCLNYNRETGEKEDHDCPYCKYINNASIRYYQNAIIREIEEDAPEYKGERTESEKELKVIDGFKCYVKESKNSPAWTPVRIIEIPTSLVTTLKDIQSLNKYKDEEGEVHTASPSDLKYGVDLLIKYNENGAPQSKYTLQRDPDSGKTPISSEMRREYLVWNLEIPAVNEEEVLKDFPRNARIATPDDYHKDALKEYLDQLDAEEKVKSAEKAQKKQIQAVTLDDDDMDDISPAQEAMSEDVSFTSKSKSSSSDDEFEDL